MSYSHILNVYNADDPTVRSIVAKNLLILFSEYSPMLKVKYWAGDERYHLDPHYVSSLYNIDFLKKHSVDIQVEEDSGPYVMYCEITNEVKSHFRNYDAAPYFGHSLKYFHIEFLNDQNNTQLYCGDFGDAILIDIDSITSKQLLDSINFNHFIKQSDLLNN